MTDVKESRLNGDETDPEDMRVPIAWGNGNQVNFQSQAVLSVSVVDDATGEAARGVRVSAPPTRTSKGERLMPVSVSQPGEESRNHPMFFFRGGGTFNIIADSGEQTSVAHDSIEVLPGERREVTLRMIDGGIIWGRVLDANGDPVLFNQRGADIKIGVFGPSIPFSGANIDLAPGSSQPTLSNTQWGILPRQSGLAVQSRFGAVSLAQDGTYEYRVAPGDNRPYLWVARREEEASGRTLSKVRNRFRSSLNPAFAAQEVIAFDFATGLHL